MKTEIITFITLCLLSYLLGCFISTSFNIAYWNESLRAFIGICGILFAFLGTGIVNDTKNK